MGKVKNKNRDESEYLKGQIRDLRKKCRSLERENRDLKKRAHFYDELVDEFMETEEIQPVENHRRKCKSCGAHDILERDFYRTKILECKKCGHQERIKVDQGKVK